MPRHKYTAAQAKHIRQRLGLSITAFAEKYGVGKSTVSQWEAGKRRIEGPSAAIYWRIERDELSGPSRRG